MKSATQVKHHSSNTVWLPDLQILINTIVLEESKGSSAIENIVTTQDELYEAAIESSTSNAAAKEVLSCREAMNAGLERMHSRKNLLLTNTLIKIVQIIKQNNAGIRNTRGRAIYVEILWFFIIKLVSCGVIRHKKMIHVEKAGEILHENKNRLT